GKVVELSNIPVIEYTDEGRLVGHITIGAVYVSEKIAKITDFPEKLRNKVMHMILSHQGANEKGSPIVPMFREALLLYFLDEIDSKLNAFDRIIKNEKKEGVNWSKFVNLIDRYIYLE
ncbi:hydrolase, partial [candidate division KSB1 bacterium]